MLSSSDLIVKSELEIYKAVERWILHSTNNQNLETSKSQSCKLLTLVRFPRMPINDLHTVS